MRHFNTIKLLLLYVITILIFIFPLSAQTNIIRGKIADSASNNPVAGATVSVRNSNFATSTNTSGEFFISASLTDELLVSFVGYESKTLRVTGVYLQINLSQTSRQLNEVVVTATGIKKETRRLGYATQTVDAGRLTQAREPNPLNSLKGNA